MSDNLQRRCTTHQMSKTEILSTSAKCETILRTNNATVAAQCKKIHRTRTASVQRRQFNMKCNVASRLRQRRRNYSVNNLVNIAVNVRGTNIATFRFSSCNASLSDQNVLQTLQTSTDVYNRNSNILITFETNEKHARGNFTKVQTASTCFEDVSMAF
jgi:hypothetical protein